MIGLFRIFRKPLVVAVVVLSVAALSGAAAAKYYHGRYNAAVAECNADKYKSAAEAQELRGDALARTLKETNEFWANYKKGAEVAAQGLAGRNDRLSRELDEKESELNELARKSANGCLVEYEPRGVWGSVSRHYQAYFGGGGEADSGPAS